MTYNNVITVCHPCRNGVSNCNRYGTRSEIVMKRNCSI